MSDALLALGTQPISDGSPAGESVRDDAQFETLQAEFLKLERPDQPTVDWDAVVKGASALLGGRGKDLLVGVYLAVGLLERDGYSGFADGLKVVHDLLANFAATMYPERPRARRAAMVFLSERGGSRVTLRGSRGASREVLDGTIETLDALETLSASAIEDGGGLFGDLRRALDAVRDDLAPAAAEPAPAAASSGFSSSPAPVAPPAAGSFGSPDEYEATAQALKPTLYAMGEYLRAADARDPLAYRLPRVAAWMTVKQAPPATDGKTAIPPPQPPGLASRMESMLASQAWGGVLEETESRLATSVFWIDLHFWAWSALRGQGPSHAGAAEAVVAEVRALLLKLPGLADLTFASGQPLAGDPTRAWIAETVLAAPGGGGAGGGAGLPRIEPEGDTFDGLADARTQAGALAAEGRLGDAVRLLEAGAARAVRARERAAWKVAVAQLCFDSARPDVALAQLEALQESLQSTTLEMWDPELAATLVRLLLAARQKALPPSQMNPEEHQRSRELLRRLARLDAAAALEANAPGS